MEELYGTKAASRYAAAAACQGVVLTGLLIDALEPGPALVSAVTAVATSLAFALFWRTAAGNLNRVGLEVFDTFNRRLLIPAVLASGLLSAATRALLASGIGAGLPRGWVLLPMLVANAAAILGTLLGLGIILYVWRWQAREVARATSQLERFWVEQGVDASELRRIERWIGYQRGRKDAYPDRLIRGSLFPGLTSRPWHPVSPIEWDRLPGFQYEVIRREVLDVCARNGNRFLRYNYPGAQDKDWHVFVLFKRNKRVEQNCALCPETTRLIETVSGGTTRDAMISLLAPGAYIAPHQDPGNLFLTCHLGLSVPKGCGIRVGGVEGTWEEGKAILFDTSYEHACWNHADQPRVCLLLEVLHPDLTPVEQAFFRALHRP